MDSVVISDTLSNGDVHLEDSSTNNGAESSEVDSRLWFSFGSGNHNNNRQKLPSNLSSIPNVIQNPVQIPNRSLLYYPLRSFGHRGRALIFNWEHFSTGNRGPREGSERDVQKLQVSLSKMGFAVQKPFQDLSASQTYHQLLQESRTDHSNFDALIIVLLSHGEKGDLICTSDGGKIKLEQITGLFSADRCPTLAGKPKLFFIQACRGTKLDPGILATDSPSETLKNFISSTFLLPTQADFFLFFSTVAGHYAWRNTSTGSWFIQDLCYVLDAFAGSESEGDFLDLGTLATLVCQRVAFTRESLSDDARMNAKKQSPVVVSTLTRLMRFGPWKLKE